uniref:Protein binding protein, putative n=1 Tax=Arundo donax TaxID=35708 RepID=A0A0A9GAX8_ARUDO
MRLSCAHVYQKRLHLILPLLSFINLVML